MPPSAPRPPEAAPATRSARHPAVQRLRRLARRRVARTEERAFVLEGPTLVADALDAGLALEAVFAEPSAGPRLVDRVSAAGTPVHHLAEGVLARVTDAATPQPVVAVAPWCDVGIDRLDPTATGAGPVLVLAGLGDPGNAGTLLRTAEAAGGAGVVFCTDTVDPFGPKCVRASAGSLFRVPVVNGGDPVTVIERLAAGGRPVLATTAHDGEPWDQVDLTGPVALVLGPEPAGLAPEVLAACDTAVTVPMAGRAESLNVAMAGAVLCFEALRQRRGRRTVHPR